MKGKIKISKDEGNKEDLFQHISPKIMAKKLSKQNGNGNRRDLGMSGRKKEQ